MAIRKGLKTVTVTGTSLPIVGFSTGVGETVETDDIAAYGDAHFTTVPRSVAGYNDLTVTCLNEGSEADVVIGSVADWTFAMTFHDGDGTETKSVSKKCVCVNIEHGEVEVDGERKATITYTLHPQGGD